MRPGVVLLAAFMISAQAQASPLPEYPFIFTSGSAEIDVPPDIVRFRVEVSAHLPEASVAMSAVEATSKRMLAVLRTAGVKDADIDASDIEKSPRRHWDEKRDRSVPDGFEVTRRFSVTVRDLARYPQMVTTLLELPHTEEFEPHFDRTDRAKIEGDLFDRAARDARANAERMAAAFGRKLGSVRGIAQVPMTEIADWLGLPTNAMYPASIELDSQSQRLLVPAAISISESVNVVFDLQ